MLTFPPDISFLIQIVSFFVLWLGLKRLVFDPVLRVLEEREARTTGVRRAAAASTAATEAAAADYQRRIQEVRVHIATANETTRAAVANEERQLLAQAREQAGAQLMQLRERLLREAEEARPVLAAQSGDLAGRVLERVLRRVLA